eukprot:5097252-Amphidinium_carterae.1
MPTPSGFVAGKCHTMPTWRVRTLQTRARPLVEAGSLQEVSSKLHKREAYQNVRFVDLTCKTFLLAALPA